MCGICGVVGGDPGREADAVRRMTKALAHRGPDGEGLFADETAVLGHRRLAIIDLDGGHQPMTNESGDLWITYNGEVYNYLDLRAELSSRGHRFGTRTDTEVLLHLYEEAGPELVHRLRGMFAFALWDRGRRTLFAARDRFGQKPFYYCPLSGGRLAFASEVKGLLVHPDVGREPEPRAAHHYLALRFVPPPLTMLRGIRKLPAGSHLTFRNGTVTVRPYWRPAFRPRRGRSESEWVAELRERIEEAVRVHTVSDVPVGAFLSGGMDSSTVTAALARVAGVGVRTFAIGSDVESYDETPFARQVARHLGTVHLELRVGRERLRGIPELVRCLDEPSDPIAACAYEAAALAARKVKVVLGGDGGDELFAGFDRYAAYRWVERYGRIPRPVRERALGPLARRLPDSFAYKSLAQRARWLDAVSDGAPAARYARMTSFFRFGPGERRRAYGPVLAGLREDGKPEAVIVEAFEAAEADGPLGQMLAADAVTRLPEHTLMLTDRLAMAHGLEVRSPLLDHELAAFCASMPARLKVRRGITKWALRRAAAPWLPPAILRRPKQGFMFPVAHWLNEGTLPDVVRRLSEGPLVAAGWIGGDAPRRLAEEHLRRRSDHHVRLWMLLNLDAWYRIYLEDEPAPEIPVRVGQPAERAWAGAD